MLELRERGLVVRLMPGRPLNLSEIHAARVVAAKRDPRFSTTNDPLSAPPVSRTEPPAITRSGRATCRGCVQASAADGAPKATETATSIGSTVAPQSPMAAPCLNNARSSVVDSARVHVR
jgi:hypothetical protein